MKIVCTLELDAPEREQLLQAGGPGIELFSSRDAHAQIAAAGDAEVIYGSVTPPLLAAAPALQWVHLPKSVACLWPPDRLLDLCAAADILVNCAPLTPQTEGMIGREQFARMKPSALLVNVSRGRVVDQDALGEALRAERLAGAALD